MPESLTPNPAAVVLLLSLAGCPQPSGSSGITIAQNDGTPPTLSLGAGQQGTQDVAVDVNGPAKNKTLTSKAGKLNLFATARDPESGIQRLEIWVRKQEKSCDAAGACTVAAPTPQNPRFEFTSPQKQPGETTAEARTMLQSLDLSAEIPQGSISPGALLKIDFELSAVAVNNRGRQSQTPLLTVSWMEP